MDDKIVLICATGRSGSTTLQRIINTIPNSNICGENYAALNSLLEFYLRIKKGTLKNIPGGVKPFTYEYMVNNKIKPSWYNSYNIYQIQQMVRQMIIAMFKLNENTDVWGFKEIRYNDGEINYIRVFKELFPQTKVIIHIKENIKAQSKSGWFKEDENALNFLYKTNTELYRFYEKHTDYCFFTSFEKMFNTENIKNIFTFIDCKEHYNEEKILEILNNNIKD